MIPFWYLYPAAVIGSLIGVVVMALCITAARYDRQNILQPLNNYFELAKTCIELLGNLCLWVIALTAVTMGIFGGSVSIKINGFERFFR